MALPVLGLACPGVGSEYDGIKGGSSIVTAAVAPEVGVGASNIESGSPVVAVPVGVAVIETGLSWMCCTAQ
jgi:hypothetical protein